jgi:hypothetical protein
MALKIGIWDGGAADEAEGTVEWAQGYTDLNDAPFVFYLKNITIEDYTTSGTEYTYGDETGDYTSIIISDGGNSTDSSSSNITTSVNYAVNSTVGTSTSDNATTTTSTPSSLTTSSSSSSATVGSLTSAAVIYREKGSFLTLVLALGVGYLSL